LDISFLIREKVMKGKDRLIWRKGVKARLLRGFKLHQERDRTYLSDFSIVGELF
jgi:hypothetical protein